MKIISPTQTFKILIDFKATTTFIKQVLDNGLHMRKLHTWQTTFLSKFNAIYKYVEGNNNFSVDYLTRVAELSRPLAIKVLFS